MSKPQHVDPGLAQQDMITDKVHHDALAGPLWVAMHRAIAAAGNDNYAEVILPHLLHAMRETHGSIWTMYTAAGKIEQKKQQPTGRWADMLILARAQFDALFVGILVAHDPGRWGPKYYKAGWATDAQHHHYAMRRFRKTPVGRAIRGRNSYCLKMRARSCKVTAKEWIATLADIRGTSLRFGASERDRIKPFPTPGQIVKENLLQSGPLELLGETLWIHWKFLCDPAHAGFSTVAIRHALRDQHWGRIGETRRAEMIRQHVFDPSLIPSLVAVATLTTVLATSHRDDVDLLAAVTKAWEPLQKGTFEGGIVWEKWASHALGALSS